MLKCLHLNLYLNCDLFNHTQPLTASRIRLSTILPAYHNQTNMPILQSLWITDVIVSLSHQNTTRFLFSLHCDIIWLLKCFLRLFPCVIHITVFIVSFCCLFCLTCLRCYVNSRRCTVALDCRWRCGGFRFVFCCHSLRRELYIFW